MQPRSALFDQTIAGPHTVLVRADVLSGGKVIASGIPVSGGSVQGNRAQFARRTCTVVIADDAYIPTGKPGLATVTTLAESYSSSTGWSTSYPTTVTTIPANLLAPYGNELRLWRGALTPAGPELLCLGTFGIRSAEYDQGAAFQGITVTGVDRCKRLSETRFPWPRTSIPQVSAIEQVVALIGEVLPNAEIRVDPDLVDATLPQQTWRQDRDQAITDIMTSIGGECFCDALGAFVLQPVPAASDPPVFTVAGGPGGVLVSGKPSLTRDGVYNGVIASATTTAAEAVPVVSDLIVDDDPTSPTYWYGNFGQITGFYESSLLSSYAQANTAAEALLRNQIGAARSINYSQLVNPAVEAGDVGLVVNPDTGEAERHLHDQVTIPLAIDGVMTAQTRSTLNPDPVLDPQLYTGLS